jgi:hypothetical protein
VTDEEFAAVTALPPDRRYEYFIQRVADSEVVWSLSEGEQFVLEEDEQGSRAVPVWPHKRYAEACRAGAWVARQPMGVHVEDFLEQVVPGAEEDGLEFAVFPVADGSTSAHVTPASLREHLQSEQTKY